MEQIVEIKDLSFNYHDGRQALSGISLSIGEGEKVALIGPNGAGKSTLLMQLNGVLRGLGAIKIAGLELNDENIFSIRKTVGVVFQDPNDQLFCPTVGDDVSFGPLHLGISKEEIDETVAASLSEVELLYAKDRQAHHLSIGERRRATIAAVLACGPKIIAMDEPQAMLDPKRKTWLANFIKGCGRTVILATHDLEFARETCTRAILINKGKIVADAEIGAILENKKMLEENEM